MYRLREGDRSDWGRAGSPADARARMPTQKQFSSVQAGARQRIGI